MATSILDAGVSSFGNLAVSLSGAQLLELEDFGILALLLMVALLGVGLIKVALVDAFTLAHSASSDADQHQASGRVLGSVALVALALSPCVVVMSLLLPPGQISAGLIALGIVLPMLQMQDAARWVSYASGRVNDALLNTLIWTAGTLLGIGLLILFDKYSPFSALLVWGLAAGIAAAASLVKARLIPDLRGGVSWLSEARGVGVRSFLDYSLGQSIGLGAGMILSAIAGSAAYGALRLAQLPLAPVQIAISGCIAFLQPTMVVRIAQNSSTEARRLAGLAAIGTSGLVCLVAVLILVVPYPVMIAILGAGWSEARGFVLVVAIGLVGSAVAAAYGPYLRAAGLLGYELRVKVLVVPFALVAMSLGTLSFGVLGGAIAQTVGVTTIAIFAIWKATQTGIDARRRAAVDDN